MRIVSLSTTAPRGPEHNLCMGGRRKEKHGNRQARARNRVNEHREVSSLAEALTFQVRRDRAVVNFFESFGRVPWVVPMGKVDSLSTVCPTPADVEQLLRLALLLPHILAHDGNHAVTVIEGYARFCGDIVERAWANERTAPDVAIIKESLAEIVNAAMRLGHLHALCSGFRSRNTEFPHSLISHIYELFSSLAASYPKHDIGFGLSSRELRIFYPSPVLYGVLNGLITNAIRHGSSTALQLRAEWSVAQDRLTFNIHDSGVGISSIPSHGMVPRSALELPGDGGLELIDRIVIASGGFLFFGRSSILGGLHVHFEIPLLYYSDVDR